MRKYTVCYHEVCSKEFWILNQYCLVHWLLTFKCPLEGVSEHGVRRRIKQNTNIFVVVCLLQTTTGPVATIGNVRWALLYRERGGVGKLPEKPDDEDEDVISIHFMLRTFPETILER